MVQEKSDSSGGGGGNKSILDTYGTFEVVGVLKSAKKWSKLVILCRPQPGYRATFAWLPHNLCAGAAQSDMITNNKHLSPFL